MLLLSQLPELQWYRRRWQLKCDKCGYISFDYNLSCPLCNKDLGAIRNRLGLYFDEPEKRFDEYFADPSGPYRLATTAIASEETELDLDTIGEDFEFTLDD
jgi:hypothetical protein